MIATLDLKGIFSRKVSGHGVDPGYESKHCLYRGGAGSKFKAKTWRTSLTIPIDRLADVMKGEY